ncbi:tRNA threonylcarbamoyladenosine biosynthesis protein TsaB [Buchnera aphidicola (Thelaxes suberi)]|uniref:tRNA (adenosine(37)-N6)-threonylcarbamoyltransferase complex dimerization subunit type 1 TsaB n=1 Tax=Buchnera aphidicola TaxID=9 RepID=UPI003463F4D3
MKSKIKILTIDASFEECSVALFNCGIYQQINQICIKNHTKILIPMIDTILKNNTVTVNQLNLIAFSRGPGNFSSIRIVNSIVQGLSIAYDIPILGVSTLKIIAEHYWKKKNQTVRKFIVCMHANSTTAYLGKYIRSESNVWNTCYSDRLIKKCDIKSIIINNNANFFYIGNVWSNNFSDIHSMNKEVYTIKPYAIDIIPIALLYFQNNITSLMSKNIFPNYINNFI